MATKLEIRRKILTYSLVSSRIAHDRDPISALEPFFSPIANDLDGQTFDATSFRREMNQRYGLAFSRDVTEVFVNRLIGLGFLRRANNTIVWKSLGKEVVDPSESADLLERALAGARSLIESRHELLKLDFDEERFLSALLSVILDQNTAIQDAVRAIAKSDEGSSDDLKFSIEDGWQWAAAEFVAWAQKHDPEIFEWVSNLSGTALVTEALVDIRTPGVNQNIRPDLAVYLDSPFLMELLGTSGTAARQDAKYIVGSLNKLRIPVLVFSHSIDEVVINLRAVLRATPRERTGPTAAALLFKDVQETVLHSVVSNPEHFVRQEGVTILDTRSDSALNRAHFSDDREQSLYASFYSHYEHEGARERDVKSIKWIISRRGGEIRTDVLKSKHILVTRNDKLVNLVDNFCRTQLQYRLNAVLPVMTVRDLAGVLWLLLGNSERETLSQRQMVLSCQRARASAPAIVSGMAEVLSGINEGNAELLWSAAQQPKYLTMAMDAAITTGASSQKTADDLLSAVKRDLVAEERKEGIDARRAMQQKFDAQSAMQRLIQTKIAQENESLTEAKAAALRALQNFSQREWKKHRTLFRRVSAGLSLLGYSVIVAATVGPIFFTDFGMSEAVAKIVSALCALVGFAGVNLLVLPWIKAKSEKKIYGRYRCEIERVAPDQMEEVLVVRRLDEASV